MSGRPGFEVRRRRAPWRGLAGVMLLGAGMAALTWYAAVVAGAAAGPGWLPWAAGIGITAGVPLCPRRLRIGEPPHGKR